MATTIAARNVSGGTLSIDQLSVPDAQILNGATVTLTTWNTIAEIQNDEQLLGYIQAGDIVLVVDGLDQTIPQAESTLSTTITNESTPFTVLKGSAGTITAGQPVYISGYNGTEDLTEVELADASSAATMPAIGVALSTITNTTSGSIVTLGQLPGINTSSYSEGDELWVSTTAGALTDTKPTGTNLVQKVGQVVRSDTTAGVIQVFGAGRTNDLPNIASANLWVGDGTGVPAAVTVSGDASMSNGGALSVTDLSIAGAVQGSTLYNDGSNWVHLPPGTDGQVLASQGPAANPQWVAPATSGAGALSGTWQFDNSTTASDPGSGEFRLNNATQGSATALYINDETENGFDASNILALLEDGNLIYIQQREDASRYLLVEVTAAPTDNGGWFTIPITVSQTGSAIEDGEKTEFVFFLAGGSITKADITDFVESDYVHTTGNETVAGIKTFTDRMVVIQAGPGTTTPYALSVQSNDGANGTYLEILNGTTADRGAFFGVFSGEFELYNWEAGPIVFYTDTTVASGQERMRINADGTIRLNNLTSGVVRGDAQGDLSADAGLSDLADVASAVGSAVQGDIFYRNATEWVRLAPGTSGQFLQTQGAGANPQWATSGATDELVKVTTNDTTPGFLNDKISVSNIGASWAVLNPGANEGYTLSLPASSATVAGFIELATQVEVDAGTDTVRAVTPATLASATTVLKPSDAAGGDLSGTYPNPSVATDAVDNTKLADMAQATVKGRASGAGTGDPTDLTGTQATAILDVFTSALQGVAPASGGGTTNFLRADGSWATPPDTDTTDHTALSNLAWASSGHTGTASNFAGFDGSGDADNLTGTEATALLDTFTSGLQGVAPASGGGTTNFLRADGTWAIPPDTDTTDHTALSNLTWVGSGHTGTASNFAGFDGSGDADNLTGTEATALLDVFTSGLQGVAPASGGGTTNFLRADGTWAAPPDTDTTDHAALSNLAWTSSGHTGAVQTIAAFNGTGAAVELTRTLAGDLSGTYPTATIVNNAVDNAKLADMAGFSVKAKPTTGTGDPSDLVLGTNTVLGRVAGNVVAAPVATTQVADNAITNAKQADMAQATLKGRASGAGTGDPTDLSGTQATAILDVFTSGLQGVAPASGGGTTNFLRADGTWAAPPDTDTTDHTALSNLAWVGSGHTGTASNFAGFDGSGDADNLTGTEATALLDTFTSGLQGLAPASGGGTANFLRADGTWATPPDTGITGTGTDNHIIRWDGTSNAQDSGYVISDTDILTVPGLVSGNLFTVDPTTDMILLEGSTAASDFIFTMTQNIVSGEFIRLVNQLGNNVSEWRMDGSGGAIFRIMDELGNNQFEWENDQLIIYPQNTSADIDADSVVTSKPAGFADDYALVVLAADGNNGVLIAAGETTPDDIALTVTDVDGSFGGTGGAIMQIGSDQGHITFYKDRATTLANNGVLWGLDNQGEGVTSDYNTQFGVFRTGGVALPIVRPADLVATSNLTLSGEQTIDGNLTSGSRVLCVGQTTASQNGLYDTAAGAWTRARDMDSSADLTACMLVPVSIGDLFGNTYWKLSTVGPYTLDTTSLSFEEFGAPARVAQYRRTTNQTINTTATTITLDANDFQDTYYSRSGSDVTINVGGIYRINYTVYFDTNANARRTVDAWVEANTVEIVPSRSAAYARNSTDDTESASATFLVQLSASDVVRLRAQSTGTSGTAIGIGNRVWITIEFVRAA